MRIRGLWTEVRRRHVLRVAFYYLAGAWVVAQVGDLLLDAFDASGYTRFVIALLVLGLPVALVLAWKFDVTPRGIERTLALARSDSLDDELAPPPAVAEVPKNSVAVLPFANLSRDPSNEYFSDGLAEEIRNQLARVSGLRVAARTSSFAFKGRHEDVREIGRKLQVATLLEGGVRKEADTVRIDLTLVSTADGFQLWSESFERRLGDVFRLQSEVSAAVIAAVGGWHGLQANPVEAATEPRDFEAYNAYLMGRHHFHQRTEAALQRAARHFSHAIDVDSAYALAYTGLADTWMLLCVRYYGNTPVEESIRLALPAAEKALSLAPRLAEAHASLGLIRLNQEDRAGATLSLEQAIELNPGYAMGHVWLGLALLAQGRYVDAAAHNAHAVRIDPLSPIVLSNAGFDALRFSRHEEAKTRFTAAIELEPGFPVPYSGLARLHSLRGEPDEAMQWIERAVEIAPGRAFYRSRQGLLRLQLGDVAGAAEAIAAAEVRGRDNEFDAELVIALLMAQGDLASLDKVATGRSSRTFTEQQRAYASLARGDFGAARSRYESIELNSRGELDALLNDDWVWCLPHCLTRAHLRLSAGDRRAGVDDIEAFIGEAEALFATGIESSDLRYWVATAHALLGRLERAEEELQAAVVGGWRNGWWARLDWNLREHLADPRILRVMSPRT